MFKIIQYENSFELNLPDVAVKKERQDENHLFLYFFLRIRIIIISVEKTKLIKILFFSGRKIGFLNFFSSFFQDFS